MVLIVRLVQTLRLLPHAKRGKEEAVKPNMLCHSGVTVRLARDFCQFFAVESALLQMYIFHWVEET